MLYKSRYWGADTLRLGDAYICTQWRRTVKNVGEAEPAEWQLVPQSPSPPASQPLSLSAFQSSSLPVPQPPSLTASQSLSLPVAQPPSLSATQSLSLPVPQPPRPQVSQPLSLPAPQPLSHSASQSLSLPVPQCHCFKIFSFTTKLSQSWWGSSLLSLNVCAAPVGTAILLHVQLYILKCKEVFRPQHQSYLLRSTFSLLSCF